jgi:L-threonylcarbamoyladenylate synthase
VTIVTGKSDYNYIIVWESVSSMVELTDLLNAVAALEKPDGIIAFPTDTVYGLGCLPNRTDAVERLYRIKGRSEDKPLILMSHSLDPLRPYLGDMTSRQTQVFCQLAQQYWPGALTLVVPKSTAVTPAISRKMETIGVRVPACEGLQALLQMIPGQVLATTSANRSGMPSCTRAGEVMQSLGRQLDLILGDDTGVTGHPSTIVAITGEGISHVLRQGRLFLEFF